MDLQNEVHQVFVNDRMKLQKEPFLLWKENLIEHQNQDYFFFFFFVSFVSKLYTLTCKYLLDK